MFKSLLLRFLTILFSFLILSNSSLAYATAPYRPIGYIGCSNSQVADAGYLRLAQDSTSPFFGKNVMWPSYDTWGGTIPYWANDPRLQPGQNPYWARFDQMVANYGQPQVIWVQLCETITFPVTYASVQTMFANIRQHAPNATLYVSAINSYDSSVDSTPIVINGRPDPSGTGVCSFLGQISTQKYKGLKDVVNWSYQATLDGLALPGPHDATASAYAVPPFTSQPSDIIMTMTELNINMVEPDHCHQSNGSTDSHSVPLNNHLGQDADGALLHNFFDNILQ